MPTHKAERPGQVKVLEEMDPLLEHTRYLLVYPAGLTLTCWSNPNLLVYPASLACWSSLLV